MTFPKSLAKIFCLLLATKAIHSDLLDLPVEEESIQINGSSERTSTFRRHSLSENPSTFIINRTSAEYCQVRLDFQSFDVGNTNINGNCIGGLSISGENNTNNVPELICGLNNDSHVFLNFDGSNPITLTMTYDDTLLNTTNQWDIEVTQILCSDTTVTSDCLQHYSELVGTVKSFNFRNVDSINTSLPTTTYQISGLNYRACIGHPINSLDQITWTQGVGTTNYYFVLNGVASLVSPIAAGTIRAAEFDDDCLTTSDLTTSDYVEILRGTYIESDSSPSDLYCGIGFPSRVYSTQKPFRLTVFTDHREAIISPSDTIAEGSVGFSLSYSLT